MHAALAVSHETNSERHSVYRHGSAKSVKGARVQKKLFDAALALIAEGNLRPGHGEIAARAGVRRNAINEQFGYVHLLLRQLVRERTLDLLVALRLPGALPEAERIAMAWMIVAGCRPDVIRGRA